jgi:rubrerythrin
MSSSISDALKLALSMEKQSYAFYMEAADGAHNPVVESVLRSLAHDEEAHAHVVERFYAALEKSHGWPVVDFSTLDSRSADVRVTEIIELSCVTVDPDSTYEEVYIFARDKEVHARDFYIEQRDANVEDHELNRFFDFLANMENVHMKMLDLLVQGSKAIAEK